MLKKSIAELSKLDADELNLWFTYLAHEPQGEERNDIRHVQQMTAIGQGQIKIDDVLIDYWKPRKTREQIIQEKVRKKRGK